MNSYPFFRVDLQRGMYNIDQQKPAVHIYIYITSPVQTPARLQQTPYYLLHKRSRHLGANISKSTIFNESCNVETERTDLGVATAKSLEHQSANVPQPSHHQPNLMAKVSLMVRIVFLVVSSTRLWLILHLSRFCHASCDQQRQSRA